MDVARRWIYAAERDQPHHKGQRSLYYVELNTGTNVVATITPIGLVKTDAMDGVINLFNHRRNISLAGPWSLTKGGRHTRHRAIVGTGYEPTGEVLA